MDEARALLISTCSALARLQMRLIDKTYDRRKTGPNTYSMSEPFWHVGELDPLSPWLDACAPRALVSNLVPAIALVQAHLLGMVEAEGPIDGRRVCIVLHHLSLHGTTWSTPVRRLAARLGVELPDDPRDFTHMASLQQEPLPGGRRRSDQGKPASS